MDFDEAARELLSKEYRFAKTMPQIPHWYTLRKNWPDGAVLRSNAFEMEWPPRSGRRQEFPEVDRAEFFELEEAREKINAAQVASAILLPRRPSN